MEKALCSKQELIGGPEVLVPRRGSADRTRHGRCRPMGCHHSSRLVSLQKAEVSTRPRHRCGCTSRFAGSRPKGLRSTFFAPSRSICFRLRPVSTEQPKRGHSRCPTMDRRISWRAFSVTRGSKLIGRYSFRAFLRRITAKRHGSAMPPGASPGNANLISTRPFRSHWKRNRVDQY
jgi:hypothetical protein